MSSSTISGNVAIALLVLLAFSTGGLAGDRTNAPTAQRPVFKGEIVARFDTSDARQAVAVDEHHFYAVNNFRITRHDKHSGEALLQWDGVSEATGPLVHLDSGVVVDGRLYAAHSNYPAWPMTSSVEVWDTRTLEHVATHSFGIHPGSMTWLDRHAGYWWGGFGNYDKVQDGQEHPYGETRFTQVVRMDDEFRILEQWALPDALHPRLVPMSNSGGSWGDDGYLYLTGHDHPEIYVMQLPATGGELDWIATVEVPGLNGQGIAWDRSGSGGPLWGILKNTRQVFRIAMPEIALPEAGTIGVIRQPGSFRQSVAICDDRHRPSRYPLLDVRSSTTTPHLRRRVPPFGSES